MPTVIFTGLKRKFSEIRAHQRYLITLYYYKITIDGMAVSVIRACTSRIQSMWTEVYENTYNTTGGPRVYSLRICALDEYTTTQLSFINRGNILFV